MTDVRRVVRTRTRAVLRPMARSILERRARDVTTECSRQSSVVIAPHPDDEVLGCGAAILAKTAAATPVRIVFVTDGTASRHPARLSPTAIGRLRRLEATAAAAALGVSAEDVTFLGMPDGALRGVTGDLITELRSLLRQWRPDTVLVTSDLDAHDDHHATCVAATRAASDVGVPLWEYPIWFWTSFPLPHPPQPSGTLRALLRRPLVRVDAAPYLDRKQQAFDAYASRQALGPLLLRSCFRSSELYLERTPQFHGREVIHAP